MNVRYVVELTDEERTELRAFVSSGREQVLKIKRAQILLAAEARTSDGEIAASVSVGTSTVYRTKQRFVEGGLSKALNDEPRPGARRKLSGKEEALLVATACSAPPQGRAHWTMELLANEMVRLTGGLPPAARCSNLAKRSATPLEHPLPVDPPTRDHRGAASRSTHRPAITAAPRLRRDAPRGRGAPRPRAVERVARSEHGLGGRRRGGAQR